MKHFSVAEWFDFVRDRAWATLNPSMQNHLEGCAECQRLVRMWREVADIAQREPSYSPPAEEVRAVKVALVLAPKWNWLLDLAERARLIFDSIREPAPAEIRGATISSRQFLQESKPFMIDLRVECEPARKAIRLNGQVLNSDEPDKDVKGIEVFLLKGQNLATSVIANASGEFDLEFQDEEDLQLFVDIRGQKVVEILLPNPLADCQGVIGEAE